MNIALEKTDEYVNGKLRKSYGDVFVRGNNGMADGYPVLIVHADMSSLVLYISAD